MTTNATARADAPGDLTGTAWRIDPTRSRLEFHVPHFWGLLTVKGRFTRYEGRLDLSDTPSATLAIEADSLDTGNAKRDAHLRSADFFDVENHGDVSFVSDAVTLSGRRLEIAGRLRAAGTSVPLAVRAELHEAGDELTAEATTTVDHRELGMTWSPMGMMRTPTTLVVHARLVRERD